MVAGARYEGPFTPPIDRRLRAYDMSTGGVLWSAELPAQPHATPMSYELDCAQYVLIAAGGDRADGEGCGREWVRQGVG